MVRQVLVKYTQAEVVEGLFDGGRACSLARRTSTIAWFSKPTITLAQTSRSPGHGVFTLAPTFWKDIRQDGGEDSLNDLFLLIFPAKPLAPTTF